MCWCKPEQSPATRHPSPSLAWSRCRTFKKESTNPRSARATRVCKFYICGSVASACTCIWRLDEVSCDARYWAGAKLPFVLSSTCRGGGDIRTISLWILLPLPCLLPCLARLVTFLNPCVGLSLIITQNSRARSQSCVPHAGGKHALRIP